MWRRVDLEAQREAHNCILDFKCLNELQLNLFTTATLGTEESGHCKEVYKTRVNVWTVHQKKLLFGCREVAIVERWLLVKGRL